MFLVVVLPGLTVVCHQALRLVLLTYKYTETDTSLNSEQLLQIRSGPERTATSDTVDSWRGGAEPLLARNSRYLVWVEPLRLKEVERPPDNMSSNTTRTSETVLHV